MAQMLFQSASKQIQALKHPPQYSALPNFIIEFNQLHYTCYKSDKWSNPSALQISSVWTSALLLPLFSAAPPSVSSDSFSYLYLLKLQLFDYSQWFHESDVNSKSYWAFYTHIRLHLLFELCSRLFCHLSWNWLWRLFCNWSFCFPDSTLWSGWLVSRNNYACSSYAKDSCAAGKWILYRHFDLTQWYNKHILKCIEFVLNSQLGNCNIHFYQSHCRHSEWLDWAFSLGQGRSISCKLNNPWANSSSMALLAHHLDPSLCLRLWSSLIILKKLKVWLRYCLKESESEVRRCSFYFLLY